jgi:hypothetical protein
MPTHFTANIKDGIDFKTYALNCARHFGVCVMLRHEPGGGEKIPDSFEPSDYYKNRFDEAIAELAKLAAMTLADRERCATKVWEDAEASRLMLLEENRKQREAYEAMLEKVKAWTPPTTEHSGLHEFMRDQIEQSIKFDCNEDYYKTPNVRLTGDQWFEERLLALKRNIDYWADGHRKEVERTEKRTAWVQALRASL